MPPNPNQIPKTKNISPLLADFSLLMVALSWGATFTIVKTAIEDLPPFPFLAIRFALAFLTLAPFLWLKRQAINKKTALKGLLLGFFLFAGYATQTIGLQYTTASNAGFITGLSIVIVPLLVAIHQRKLPPKAITAGALTATIGLALLSIGDNFSVNSGDPIVLTCAFFYALHIFFVGRFAPGLDATVLTAFQLLMASALNGVCTLLFPQPQFAFTPYVWFGLFITAVFCTSLAFLIQTKMQQFTSASHTAIIFAAEPVFAALFAFLLAGELLSLRGYIGAALVLAGILLAELSSIKKNPLPKPQAAAKLEGANQRKAKA
ncbi:MAG TPA: DMT family transporter [Peptococcaceae bacterium]|nr:DMT family transporter [Peptococcaceae bacterium]